MHFLVTGSNGFLGSTLVASLVRDAHRVTTLVRGEAPPVRSITRVRWDPGADSLDLSVVGNVDAVVHLGAVGIADRRWNPRHKAAIRNSRVRGTRLLSKAIAALPNKPEVMIVASAMGYYGDRGDELLAEDSGHGEGFLAEVAVEWERSADPAREAGIRVVNARLANILGSSGGMVPKMKIPYQTGLGGPIGSGNQWWPWIAVEDAARAIRFIAEHKEISGPVNVSAPNAVRQKDFAKAFAGALGRPAFMPLPGWAARLVIGELAGELLSSQRLVPRVLLDAGFEWLGADLDTTFRHVFRPPVESEWR